jgi:hypothetical protein
MKKSTRRRTALFWFGFRDVGILHSRSVIQRTIVVSPTFLKHGSAENIAVCAHTNRDPNKQERHFCILADQNFKLFSNIKN